MHQGERSVAAHTAGLKKELGLGNLVLTQILFVMGLGWVGAAAKLGPSHVVFWLLAVLLFYIPSAIVVVHLSRRMPLEDQVMAGGAPDFHAVHRRLEALDVQPLSRSRDVAH